MELADLSHDQKIALVALMEAVAMSDTDVTEAEQREIGEVARALGDQEYRSLMEEADERFADLDSLKVFLQAVEDQEARELIYGTVWEEAIANPVLNPIESVLLDWLAREWDLQKPSSDA